MLINTEISNEDIIDQIKISCKYSEVLKQVIIRKTIEEESVKAGIQIDKKELQDAADNFRIRNGLTTAKNTQLWLYANHISVDIFEQIIRLELLIKKLKEIVIHDKVEQHFYQHEADFDRVILYEVVLENKDLATELFYAIREGEIKFQDVANKYIIDTELRRKGGYIGEIKRKNLNNNFSSIFSGSAPPKIMKPIASKSGFHLVWVEEIIKSRLDDDTYIEITDYLFEQYLKKKAEQI